MLRQLQKFYLGEHQKTSLFFPNQMRTFGLDVDNVPKHLIVNNESMYSIYTPDLDLRVSLEMDGNISYINNFYPSESKFRILPLIV